MPPILKLNSRTTPLVGEGIRLIGRPATTKSRPSVFSLRMIRPSSRPRLMTIGRPTVSLPNTSGISNSSTTTSRPSTRGYRPSILMTKASGWLRKESSRRNVAASRPSLQPFLSISQRSATTLPPSTQSSSPRLTRSKTCSMMMLEASFWTHEIHPGARYAWFTNVSSMLRHLQENENHHSIYLFKLSLRQNQPSSSFPLHFPFPDFSIPGRSDPPQIRSSAD